MDLWVICPKKGRRAAVRDAGRHHVHAVHLAHPRPAASAGFGRLFAGLEFGNRQVAGKSRPTGGTQGSPTQGLGFGWLFAGLESAGFSGQSAGKSAYSLPNEDGLLWAPLSRWLVLSGPFLGPPRYRHRILGVALSRLDRFSALGINSKAPDLLSLCD